MQHDLKLIEEASNAIASNMPYSRLIEKITSLVSKNEDWRRKQCINLVASEALMSPTAQAMLASGLSMCTAGGYIGEKNRYFVATKHIDQLESYLFALLTDLFHCDHVEYRLLGGTQACHAVYASLCQSGDTIIAVSEAMGGDSANTVRSMPGWLNLNILSMPFCNDGLEIDLVALEQLVNQHKPRLISVGFSVALFAPDFEKIKSICQSTNTLIYYDAAHELGLIAGKQLPDPFAQGVDVISGSTGKSFSGPQGGLILWNESQATQKLKSHIFPDFIGTYQLNRVAALCITSFELREFGVSFMSAVVQNAQALANSLAKKGIEIWGEQKSYTQTNQLLIRLPRAVSGHDGAKQLERINIICNPVKIPGDTSSAALRLSTTEVTRQGMGTTEMNVIAELIAACLQNTLASDSLAEQTIVLKEKFQKVKYY